ASGLRRSAPGRIAPAACSKSSKLKREIVPPVPTVSLRMLQVDDGWGGGDREAPKLVGRNQRIADGVEPGGLTPGLPFESFIESGFREDGERTLGAIHRRLARIVVPASLGEIRPEPEQRLRPAHAGSGDTIQPGPGSQQIVHRRPSRSSRT